MTKNLGGRPRSRPIKPGMRVPMAFRVTPEMKAKIDAAAVESGRSLTQEMEMRLERTFRDDEVLAEMRQLRAMLREVR